MRRFILPIAALFVLAAGAGLAGAQTPQTPQSRPEPPPQPWVDPPAPPTSAELRTPPPAAKATPSGLVTEVLRAGHGEPPDGNDMVMAHFTGWTVDGREIQTTKTTRPVPFDLQNVFPGWREGLLLMTEGEQRRLWIPGELGSKATAGQDTVFDVEVMAIGRIPNLPDEYRKPPEGAARTRSGAFTKVLEAGEGTAHPEPEANALVAYVGWHPDGRVFDATGRRGRMAMFPLDRVLPAFAECVQLMTVGEKRLCWIPGAVAGGQWMGSPKGDLIFEIQLQGIYPAGTIKQKAAAPPSSGG